jgi:hypothetical protein
VGTGTTESYYPLCCREDEVTVPFRRTVEHSRQPLLEHQQSLLDFRAGSTSVQLSIDRSTQRYNVGTDTPKLCATSCGGVPLANSFLAA